MAISLFPEVDALEDTTYFLATLDSHTMLRRRVGLQVVRAFARQRLRRVGLVGIPRTTLPVRVRC